MRYLLPLATGSGVTKEKEIAGIPVNGSTIQARRVAAWLVVTAGAMALCSGPTTASGRVKSSLQAP